MLIGSPIKRNQPATLARPDAFRAAVARKSVPTKPKEACAKSRVEQMTSYPASGVTSPTVLPSAIALSVAIRKKVFTLNDERSAKDDTTEAPPPIQASQLDDRANTKAKTTITKMWS